MRILTDTEMPPFGVAEAVITKKPGLNLFQFWLSTHATVNIVWAGPRFWRTAVLRECLPPIETEELEFEALGVRI